MDTQAAEVVPVREEAWVDLHSAGVGVGVDARHPGTYAAGIEDLIPRGIERVREVDPLPVAAYLDHLRPARQGQVGSGRVWSLAGDPAQAHRAGLFRVMRIGHVVLLELSGAPAGDIQPAVIDRE